MARRVYLHVGAMKSATSYLQALFDLNEQALLDQGLLWSGTSRNFLATDDLLGTRRDRPGLENAWNELTDRLDTHDGDALVSNELLAPINARKRKKLVRALAPAEVHVVITARDLARVVPSQWQTGARNRNTVAWDAYVSSLLADDGNDVAAWFWRRQDIVGIVQKWARTVSLDRVTVVTVPPAGVAATVLGERFGSVVGIAVDDLEQPPYSNPSLGAISAELLRRLNERTGDLDWLEYRWAFKHALAKLVLAERAEREPPIVLSAKALDWARERGQRMADALAACGVRVVGDLSDLVPPDSADAPADLAGPPKDAELLDGALDALAGLGVVLAEARIEHSALVHDVDKLLADEITQAERDEFDAYERALPDSPGGTLFDSRFLRWWLAR
jgi:hypothetical protein